MGRFTGYWWAPDGRSIAYEEADAEGVEVWQVADPIHPDQAGAAVLLPTAGQSQRQGAAGDRRGTRTRFASSYNFRSPSFSNALGRMGRHNLSLPGRRALGEGRPDDAAGAESHANRTGVIQCDPATGKTTLLLTERDAAWVDIRHDCPRWLKDGSFLWVGEGKAGPQLERRDKDGALLSVLVPPEVGFQELLDFDPDAGRIAYRASTDPTESQLYVMPVEGGKPTQVSKGAGQHTAVFAKGHEVYVETYTSTAVMPKTTFHTADGGLVGELPSVAEEPPFALNTETVKVGDGAGYYAYVVRPHGFDKAKRYPVIMHVYGGPTHLMVQDAMGGRLIDQWLADQGFIVAAVDNRGTPGRGRDWEKAVSRHFGSVPLEDQIAGLKALGKRFPEMDLGRVGVYGWSFGGYLSALAVLKAPDVYKAAVAGAPVVDWLDYDTHYTERYLGLPDADAAAYKEASLLTYAADLKRPLLLVHGTADDNVYFRHTLKLTNALFRAGKDFDLLPLAGMTHMTPDPVVMERLYERIAGHFRKHLGGPEARKGL